MKRFFIIIAFTICCSNLLAQTNKNIRKLADNVYQAGILVNNFRFERAGGSERMVGYRTWVACIVMAVNYNGLNIRQDQLGGTTVYTNSFTTNGNTNQDGAFNPEDSPVNPIDLVATLNTASRDATAPISHVYCELVNVDADAIFDELSNNRPLIVGIRGDNQSSANVITAMTYSIKYNAEGEQVGIVPGVVSLRDPWPTSPGQTQMKWSDFIRAAMSMYSIRVGSKS